MITVSHKHHQIPAIYMITNSVNSKIYIGQTVNLYKRYKSHERSGNNADHHNRPLVAAFKKYGFGNFGFSILERFNGGISELTTREQYWMDKLQSHKRNIGYNACPAAASPFGYRHTLETRKKVSIASAKRKMSLEARLKMSKWHTGKRLSDETKAKISIAKTGVKHGNTKGRRVAQFDINYKKINDYKSITMASKTTAIHLSSIARSCKQKHLKAGGYYWRYI